MLKVLEPDISHAPSGLQTNLQRKLPEFRLIKGQLPPLNPKAIENAVSALISEIDVMGDHVGFFNQTLKTIASSTFLGGPGDFWLAEEDGEVMAYAIAHTCNDIDDKLTYILPQAWVHKRYRHHATIKAWWELIRTRAKETLAQHLLIVSSRSPRAFARFLGHGMHAYCTTMKEDF